MSRNKDKDKEEEKDAEIDRPITGRRRDRRCGDQHEQAENSMIWLVSFTDVMALMLTFFVLLFSMTEPAKKDWSEITSALHSEFNKFYGSFGNHGSQDTINLARINFNSALNIDYLESLIETSRKESRFLENITLNNHRGTLVISLPRELLFEPGQATVKEDGTRALYALGGTLSRIKNKVEIVGHADPRPVSQKNRYDSNWELSLARAAGVAGILETVGYEGELTVRGSSSGRYDDLMDLKDEERRLDLSRRVDIVVLSHDGSREKVFLDSVP